MRTTVDLPDDLLRKAKAIAALRGVSLKSLFGSILSESLNQVSESITDKKPPRNLPPVMIPGKDRKVPTLTNAEIFEILDRIDEHLEKRSA